MAIPASTEALRLAGNLNFFNGGVSVDYLVGAFVKSAAFASGVWTLTFQNASGVEETGTFPPGWEVAATEPTSPYAGQGWYDTTAGSLKIHNGSSFQALTGGTGATLADGSVTTAKLAPDAVTTAKIATNAVTKNKIQADAVGVAELSIDAVEERKIKDNAVTQRKIADNSVGTPELIVNAVTTAKIATGAVTDDELASASVTEGKIAVDAVTAGKIADNAVTSAKIADDAVGTNEIENDKVTTAKLDAGDAVKQDAFLARLNALRRDLNNIATLTIEEQRTLLLSLGSLIDGPRPAPSAAYSARTWIDDHNDRAYVCRNRQEVSAVLGGGFADFNTSAVGVEIAENLGDLDDPASVNDYAYTYSDNKWWRGAVHNSQNVWRETQPTTALSGLLTTTQGWSTVWLGQHRWDYNARQQLPQSALPANTDYYFFNSRTVTIRKFNLASYVATGTVLDHWQWEPLVATAAEIDILEARDGNLPPLANDGTDDRQIAVANDGIHFVQLIPEAATPATTGAWASYDYSTSSPARAYIGVLAQDDPSGSVVGDFYYNSTWHRWRIYRSAGTYAWFNDHWEDMSDEDVAWPVRFVGHHGSRAEATAYAASYGITTGQTFVAFTGSQIETGSTFFQGTSARFSRHWRFLPLNPPTSTRTLYIDDVFSMPGDVTVEIENGEIGRHWKSVYGIDHTVSISEIKVQVQSESGESTWQIHLLKGVSTAPNSPVEDTIHVSELLWPLTSEQLTSSAEFSAGAVLTEHTFKVPEVEVKRGEYLVVQLGRVSLVDSKPRVRVVRDLTEHHAFNAFRFVGSGADNRDSGASVNHNVDNVEWTDAGLWIEIGYAIKYDVDAALATHGTDDFTQLGTFSLSNKELSLRLTRELGGVVDVAGVDLSAVGVPALLSITEGQLNAGVTAKLQTDADVTTIADARALARYTVAEKTKLSDSPADDSISTVKIIDNAVSTVKLASNAVTTAKIKDLNITTGKLAENAVTTAKVVDANITAPKLAPNSVTQAKVAVGSITPVKLDAGNATKKTEMRTHLAAAAIDSPVFTGHPTRAVHLTNASLAAEIATKRYVDENVAAVSGGGLGDATNILATTGSSAIIGTGATEVTLSATLVKGRLLEFILWDNDGANKIMAVGYLMSDVILSMANTTGNPTTGSTVLPRVALKLHQAGNTDYSHDTLHIWRSGIVAGDEAKLWVHSGRDQSIRLTINSYDLSSSGGGGGGAVGAGTGGTSGSSTTVNTRRLQLILHQWGATQPADPTQVWETNGWTGTIDGDATSSWVEDEPSTTPAGTHWIALANAYSLDAGATWAQYAWSVFSVGAGYLAEQYSEDASSWHSTRTDYDSWMRLRRPDGTWTGSIALKAVPWQPILDWADVYRPNYQANAKVAWKFNINEVDLLTYNDLALEAQFFYYINGPPDHFSAVARTSIPLGTANKDGVLVHRHATSPTVHTPSTDLRWQTIPQDFLLTDWTSTVADREVRRQGVFRAVLDRDNGLSCVLGEGARSTPDDATYERATICFGLQTAATGAYNSTINAIAIYVPPGTQAYSRTQIRIVGR